MQMPWIQTTVIVPVHINQRERQGEMERKNIHYDARIVAIYA